MNNYEIDIDTIAGFWSSAFMAMSSQWFASFTENLSFPLQLTDELFEIGQEFTIAFLNYIEVPVPKILDIKVSRSNNVDPLIEIWEHSISRLESDAQAFIQWGKTQQTYSKLDVSLGSDWYPLLVNWATNLEQYANLNLSNSLINQLQLTILRNFVKYQRTKIHVHQAEQVPLDEWSKYVFNQRKIGSWISNMTWLNTEITMLTDIFSLLSAEQLTTLQAWGDAHQKHKPLPSLLEIRKMLETINY